MEPKNVMLLGFVNRAVDYLDKHMDDETNSVLTELQNIDLLSLKNDLSENLGVSLGSYQSTIETLLKAGEEAFDRFIDVHDEKDSFPKEIEKLFDVDLDDDKKDLEDLIHFYNLDELNVDLPEEDNKEDFNFDFEQFEIKEDNDDYLDNFSIDLDKDIEDYLNNVQESETKEELKTNKTYIIDEFGHLVEKTETDEEVQENEEESVSFEEDSTPDEQSFEMSDEDNELYEKIVKSVSDIHHIEVNEDDKIDNEDVEATDVFVDEEYSDFNIADLLSADELESNEEDTIDDILKMLDEDISAELDYQEIENILNEPFNENPGVSYEEFDEIIDDSFIEEEVYPEAVDKDDFIELVKNMEASKEQYYNHIEDIVEEIPVEEVEEKVEEENVYSSQLIDELRQRMLEENERKSIEEKEYMEVSERIHNIYPYLSNSFIKSVYDMKGDIARAYPLNVKLIVLHRIIFKDVENLRQFVEIALSHDYLINADENKLIVDVFKEHINTDGKIITSIYDVANQSALLNGEYDGYSVLLEERV